MAEEAILIRPAREADAPAIARINREALGYEGDEEAVARRLSALLKKPEYRLFVAETGGRVAGYLHAGDYDLTYMDPMKNILALAVLPETQGQGLGRALLERAEAWAREECCAGVRLVSGMNRGEAHAFYLRCGYRDRKDQKNFIKVFEDEA